MPRGEGVIHTEDREVRVFFNNRALAQAEDAMEKSVIAVANGFRDGETRISDLTHLLRAGMEAHRRLSHDGRRPISLNDAHDVMDEAGFAAVAEAIMVAIAEVLGYSPSENGSGADADPNR